MKKVYLDITYSSLYNMSQYEVNHTNFLTPWIDKQVLIILLIVLLCHEQPIWSPCSLTGEKVTYKALSKVYNAELSKQNNLQ